MRLGDKLGVSWHSLSAFPSEYSLLRRAFRGVRVDISWPAVESECGFYNFSVFDELYLQARTADLELTYILDYNNPGCYPTSPNNSLGCNDPNCIQGFISYAAATAAHFSGKHGVFFECQNEPNSMGQQSPKSLASMCGGAGAAFEGSSLPFFGPATLQFDIPYLQESAFLGLFQNLSAVSTHAFGAYPPEGALHNYSLLKTLVSGGAMVQSEAGFPSGPPGCTPAGYPALPSALSALYLVRTTLTALLAGVQRSNTFQWKDVSDNASVCDEGYGWGVVTSELLPKPQFLALVALQEWIGDSPSLIRRLPILGHPQGFAIEFSPPLGAWGGYNGYVVWDSFGGECSVGNAPCGSPSAAHNATECLLDERGGCCFNEYRVDGGPPCFKRTNPSLGASFFVEKGGARAFTVGGTWGQVFPDLLYVINASITVPSTLWGQGPIYLVPFT